LIARICRRALMVVVSTTVAVVAVERVLKWWEDHRSSKLVDYGGTWRQGGLGPGGFLQEGFDGEVIGEAGRMVRWHTNAAGLRYDTDLAAAPPPGTRRILVLGDSFAAGYRTDQHETFAARAEAELRRRGVAVEMPIAVIEEPVIGLLWLQEHGMRLAPDVVVLTICLGNDIAQTFLSLHERGRYHLDLGENVVVGRHDPQDPIGFHHGLERLQLPRQALVEDPPERVRAPFRLRLLRPWLGEPRRAIRPGYGGAHPHQLFDPHTGFGCCLRSPPPEVMRAYAEVARTLAGYQRLCASAGVRFVVLLAPQPFQVQRIDWDLACTTYGLRPSAFDLDLPQRTIAGACREHGIPCLDPTIRMRAAHDATGLEMYQSGGDMHWQSAGHRLAAEELVEGLAAILR